MANQIEQEYIKLGKKYKLPEFKEIDAEFEISSLDNEKFLIKNTLRKISEKLEFYTEVIGNLVSDGPKQCRYDLRPEVRRPGVSAKRVVYKSPEGDAETDLTSINECSPRYPTPRKSVSYRVSHAGNDQRGDRVEQVHDRIQKSSCRGQSPPGGVHHRQR